MEFFKPQRSQFELENSDNKRHVNADGFTQIVPLESGRTLDILQQALAGQILPTSATSSITTNTTSTTLLEETYTDGDSQQVDQNNTSKLN